MVEWHVAHRVPGLMVLGTCGEGPWLPDEHRRQLIRETAHVAAGRIAVAAQVTDNSVDRVLEQVERAALAGADYAVVAQPYFALKARAPDLPRFYREIAERSSLPLGFYDRGASAPVPVPGEALSDIVSHPQVKFVKDSSGDPTRAQTYLSIRTRRSDLVLMSGNEFKIMDYLNLGYDGLLLGGAVISSRHVRAITAAFLAGDLPAAQAANQSQQAMLRTVYGGPGIPCWLSGLKYLLVRLGVFSSTANHPGYDLTPECRLAIDRLLDAPDARFLAASPGIGQPTP